MGEYALVQRQIGRHAVVTGGVHRAPAYRIRDGLRRDSVCAAYRHLEEKPRRVAAVRRRVIDREGLRGRRTDGKLNLWQDDETPTAFDDFADAGTGDGLQSPLLLRGQLAWPTGGTVMKRSLL